VFKRCQHEGIGAILKRQRGRRPGEQLTLKEEQAVAIQKMIIEKTPDQLKMPFALWTQQAMQELIKQHFKITIPIRTEGEYLKRWGFTAQKSAKRAYE